jgi:HEAT repeat protein
MKEVPFSTVLAALTSPDRAFPARYLPRFSDLEGSDLAAFVQTWHGVSLEQKRVFLRNLVDKFEEDTIVSYEAMAAKIIKDDDALVRVLALKLLIETSDNRLITPITHILNSDPDPEVRAQAAIVLGGFVHLGELEELAEHKLKQVEDALLLAAHHENAYVGRAALEALGYSARPEVAQLIENALNRHDPLWQASGLFAAGRSGLVRWQEYILTGLLSEDDPVRLAAAQSVGLIDLKIARKPLLDMLEEEADDDVFQAIIWSLSQIGGEDVRTYLEAILAEADDDDQIEFLEEALANLSFTEDMEEFDMLAFDPDDPLDDGKE